MSATVLVANPSADLYGSDLQLLQSIGALRADGWRVVVAAPADGPLLGRVRELGAEAVVAGFPVLRRADASARGVLSLGRAAAASLGGIRSLIRRYDPTLVYVNTLTLPWWLLAARTCRKPVVCHVHEAERADHRAVRYALAAPLRIATACIVNSRATMTEVLSSQPQVANRLRLVHNGVPGPPGPSRPRPARGPFRLAVVGRLTERKGVHIALEAASRLVDDGHDIDLEICGSSFDPQSPYVERLSAHCAEPTLTGRVRFTGYTSPIWPTLERTDILLAPSFGESFGNAVVEAQLASRPVVATAVQGHLETVTNDQTGLLVPVGDAAAMAAAVERLISDSALASRLAERARLNAADAFAPRRYNSAITSIVRAVARSHPAKTATEAAMQT